MATSPYAVHEHHDFMEASREALNSANLQTALNRLGETLAAGNRTAFELLPGSSLLRDKARSIKDHTLAQLDQYLEQLERAVIQRGGHVHYAADAADAQSIVVEIARQSGVKSIVKSKSMVTEEIHLNKHLEAAGFEVTETDFGEYIIQLAGERPSHIVAPVVHKTVEEVAEIMNRRLNSNTPADAKALAQQARRVLRAKFETADMGISGGNFLVAETGTLVLITNEGNGRLTTTVPKIHMAIVGIEKVIPKLSDLPIFLKILARAATGQKLSIYTSMITGPRRPEEADGPEEFHLVLLDNGRSKILGSPMRESLFCIRCGACLNACPVYRKIGGHAYGGIYSGPIGAILTPLFDGLKENHHQPHASSLCGACQAACPVKIQIPELLIRNRAALHDQHLVHWAEVMLYRHWSRWMKSPRWYGWATWMASRVLSRLARSGWMQRLPGPLSGWTASRDFPTPPAKRFRDLWNEELRDAGE
ncbi:MAG: iron-sulfur cluster binding protein [Planctomycetaceae bacterium]|nr:iron-sulfur cluster binding protein [Planctomycetaceae bacterium]